MSYLAVNMKRIINTKVKLRRPVLIILLFVAPETLLMADHSTLMIDDRSATDSVASSGNSWRLITDDVMGGVSRGEITNEAVDGRQCLRMQGKVKLDNNGGFIQTALDLSNNVIEKITDYTGLMLEVYGNNEPYNLHLRTKDNWLPWQAYRATFDAPAKWTTLHLPFIEFRPYRTRKALNIDKIKRIGLVAIGREFDADLCIGKIALYQ